jgi:NAD(P)-dependent dehydrogenase (short-subunit alcohol dehydrogenase family)
LVYEYFLFASTIINLKREIVEKRNDFFVDATEDNEMIKSVFSVYKKTFLKFAKFIARKINRKEIIPIISPITKDKLLVGKRAIIIGGTGGIGFAIAKELVESGCKVILAARDINELNKCVDILGLANASTVKIDLERVDTFEDIIKNCAIQYGRLDILVNAAGTHTCNVDFFTVTVEEYNRVMNINLRANYFFSREMAKYMIDNNIKGHILNIISSTSEEPAWSPYRISKRGLKGFTEGLAEKLNSKGIVVNAIAPGSVATKLNNYQQGQSIKSSDNICGRYIMPEEIASYAKLFVSDLGNMTTGTTLFISGGRGIVDIR